MSEVAPNQQLAKQADPFGGFREKKINCYFCGKSDRWKPLYAEVKHDNDRVGFHSFIRLSTTTILEVWCTECGVKQRFEMTLPRMEHFDV